MDFLEFAQITVLQEFTGKATVLVKRALLGSVLEDIAITTKGLTQGRSAVFFLIQRSDANSFRPNMETDPDFAANLKEANRKGVEVYAYSSRVDFDGVFLGSRVPIEL